MEIHRGERQEDQRQEKKCEEQQEKRKTQTAAVVGTKTKMGQKENVNSQYRQGQYHYYGGEQGQKDTPANGSTA